VATSFAACVQVVPPSDVSYTYTEPEPEPWSSSPFAPTTSVLPLIETSRPKYAFAAGSLASSLAT